MKMKVSLPRSTLIILAITWITSVVNGGGIVSLFEKSTVIFNTCPVKIHESLNEKTIFDCARICAKDSDCRRFLFCSTTSLCQLFVDGGPCQASPGSVGCSCYSTKYSCNNGACTCPLGYHGDNCQNIITDCSEAYGIGISYWQPVVLNIQPQGALKPLTVQCFAPSGGWLYILRRDSECQPEDMNRSLAEYEAGFGVNPHNSWIGFNKLLVIMAAQTKLYNLNVFIHHSQSDEPCYSYYSDFDIDKTDSKYTFQANQFKPGTPNCGDSMSGLIGNSFSTSNRDLTGTNKCGTQYQGGWWFNPDTKGSECSRSFLFGTMNGSSTDNFWKDILGNARLMKLDVRLYHA